MEAINAVMAYHYLERSDVDARKKVAREVARIIQSVNRHREEKEILEGISENALIVQMNFVALACDNMGIAPPLRNCVWSRVSNPYLSNIKVKDFQITAAVAVIQQDDGIVVHWPGNEARINFVKMNQDGLL